MKIENTFTITIYVGAKDLVKGTMHTYDEALRILTSYCNSHPLCVTLKETEYIYTNGSEKGFEIGLINYPKFPVSSENILKEALAIGDIFKDSFNQQKVTLVCPDKTYMIGE